MSDCSSIHSQSVTIVPPLVPLLPKDDSSIYNEYFHITKEYKQKYGDQTVLLMQVGSFFEIYGLKEYDFQTIETISQICQFNISEKKAIYNNHTILMAGFPDYRIDKYLQKLTEGGYSVVVFVQEKNEKNTKRIFHSVHSVGTFISYETENNSQITNNVMCVWMEKIHSVLTKNTPQFVCGISVINIFTGKSSIFQYQIPYLNNPSTFDELERSVSIYSPSEIILISPFQNKEIDTIIQYSGIKTNLIHKVDTTDEKNTVIQNCMKQKYIKEMLSNSYTDDIYNGCMEFNNNEIATQSFCYLLDFIKNHNPNLIRKIDLPEFNNTSNRVLLLNHTIKQLNIIDDDTNNGSSSGILSSVLTFLNKCCCSMGKRRLKKQLLNPTFCEEWLNTEYSMIDLLRTSHYEMVAPFRKLLSQIKDIEKICRQIVIKKIYPSSIFQLCHSIQIIQQMNVCFMEMTDIQKYLCEEFCKEDYTDYIDNSCFQIIQSISSFLLLDKCKGVHSVQNFEENIICSGVSEKLDELIKKNKDNETIFCLIREHLNQLLNENEKTKDIEYVKEHITEKSGKSLVITKKRGNTLKNILSKMSNKVGSQEPFLKITEEIKIHLKDIKIIHSTTSNDEISFPLMDTIIKELMYSKEKRNKEISILYASFIEELEKYWLQPMEHLSTFISKLDVLVCKTYISKEYNYCKPSIVNDATCSYVEATDLRHILIEHINTNELYVPNDCSIGKDETKGVLLLGINMAGKSSYIKSIGISIILAQAGCYVPASTFTYKPYKSIFSRIISNDNLFKNLSLFAVEMIELRTILKNSDQYSLVLLDELSNGSETQSSVSILLTTLIKLYSIRSSFICSTHFHEILQFSELKELIHVKIKHLYVYYDRDLDCLVYDRKLKEGSGPSSYGLEVCKSLYFPTDFIEKAIEIRNKYYPENKGILSNMVSTYNAKKIKNMCEICHEKVGHDIHHLDEQMNANANGFIGHFHKNHPANLINICEDCHKKEHSKEKTPKNEIQWEIIMEPDTETSRGNLEGFEDTNADPIRQMTKESNRSGLKKKKTTKGIKLI